jgi:hypothetical protein
MWAAWIPGGLLASHHRVASWHEDEEEAWQAMAEHGTDVEQMRANLRLGHEVAQSMKCLSTLDRGELCELYRVISQEYARGDDRHIFGERRPLAGQGILDGYLKAIEKAGLRKSA